MKKDKLTHNDIEFYLLNREYNELQGDEKQFVDSQISSEQEFNELKGIMQGVNFMFDQEEELTPSPQIKANLLKEFEKNRPAGGFWLNGTIVTLFPREKSFFRKPGVQLLAMAASVALLIGIFFINDNGIQNNSLALHQENEKSEVEKHIQSEEEVAKDLKVIDELEVVEDEETINQIIADISTLEEKELERSGDNPPVPAETSYFANGETKDIDFDANNTTATGGVTTVNTSTDYRLSSVTEETSVEEDDKLIISGDLDATVLDRSEANRALDIADNEDQYLDDEVSKAASISTNSVTESLAKKEKTANKVKSRSLAEDDTLIDLLYTAL